MTCSLGLEFYVGLPREVPDERLATVKTLSPWRGVLALRYTPLATEYVDKQVTDAAFQPGSLKEDATLQVRVEAWDDGLWSTHTSVTLKLTARLVDSRSGGELWSAKLDRRFDLTADRDRHSTDSPLKRLLCDTIATELLSALPARSARPGRAE